MNYEPKQYWENRLSKRFDLTGVGHIYFNDRYNDWLYRSKIRALQKAFMSQRIELKTKTVCDIGCGTGFFVDFYNKNCVKAITGIDITKTSIMHLQQKYPNYRFVTQDISTADIKYKVEEAFDIVSVFDVLYHIKDDNLFMSALSNIIDLTKQGGTILITDRFGIDNINYAKHVRYRSKGFYESVFKKRGVQCKLLYPLFHLMNNPVLGKIPTPGMRKIGKIADNYLAPLYYFMDNCFAHPSKNNLNLMLAKKEMS